MKHFIAKVLKKEISLSEEQILNLIEIPPSFQLGDYSFPCFILAKTLKKNPSEIALDLAKKIKAKEFEKIKAKGPYVNFFVDKNYLIKNTLEKIQKEREKYGAGRKHKEKIMVEFSQPNTHKAFHIGHARGTSLGESISRILEFSGFKVIRANYSGDTGMHIAKWLWCYKRYHKDEKLRDDESWIANIYVDAVNKLKDNPQYQEEADEVNRKLESREDKQFNELWKKTRKVSINAWKQIYKDLNTKFNKHYFESQMEKEGKSTTEKLFKKGIVEISDGAIIADLKKYDLGILVMLRKDGTVLYSAKDLALAEKKFNDFRLGRSIHVVGQEQNLYFKQLFKIFELSKSPAASKSKHVSYGEVRFPWGKMSSRTGENILYSDFKKELLDYAKKEIVSRHHLSEKEIEKRALIIVIAAIKYTMLKQDAGKTFVFEKKEAIKFEGNTGPYLLYSYARAKNILKKSGKLLPKKIAPKKISETEKELISQLSNFPEIVAKANETLSPNLIANYSYQISQTFNEFYHSNPVIGSDEESFRLILVDSFLQVLKNSLRLLGIETLEQM